MKHLKSRLTTLFKVLFAVGLIYWLIATKKLSLDDVKPFLSFYGLSVGFVLIGANIFLLGERWRYLIRAHVPNVPFWPTVKLNLMGIFFNFAMPGGIGGDVIKAYYLQKDLGSSRTIAFTSALMDRALGLYSAVIMALAAILFEYSTTLKEDGSLLHTLLIWGIIMFAGLNFGLLILIFWKWPASYNHAPGLKGKLFSFMHSCQVFIKSGKQIITAVLITLVGQLFTVVFFGWALRNVLGNTIDWSTLFFIVPVGFMVMAIPLTPAGVGVGQAAFYFLFQHFSQVDKQSGPAVVTAFQLMQFLWGLIGAYYYLTRQVAKSPSLKYQSEK